MPITILLKRRSQKCSSVTKNEAVAMKSRKSAPLNTLKSSFIPFKKRKGMLKRTSGAAAKMTPISEGIYPTIVKTLGKKIT